MNRLLLSLFILVFASVLRAQTLHVWKDAHIVFEVESDQCDSITFHHSYNRKPQTIEANDILRTSAILSAKLEDETVNGFVIKECGAIVIKGDETPTLTSTNIIVATTEMNTDGTFSATITNLFCDAIYTWRPFAIYSIGDLEQTVYGDVAQFSTQKPTAIVSDPTSIDYYSAKLNLSIDEDIASNKKNIVQIGYSTTTQTPEKFSAWGLAINHDSGQMNGNINDLQPCTQYYYAVRIGIPETYNYSGWDSPKRNYYYSEVKNFTTKCVNITTLSPTEVSTTSAKLHGMVDSDWAARYGSTVNFGLFQTEIGQVQKYIQASIADDGAFETTITGLAPNRKYSVFATGSNIKSDTITFETQSVTDVEPEAVDLGLSVLWASFDLGSTSAHMAGTKYYFAETQESYSENCYSSQMYVNIVPYFTTSPSSQYSKYNNTDKLTVLESCDDAATVRLGNGWRIPTSEEFKELRNNCKWVSTTLSDGSEGYYVVGKNGNSIVIRCKSTYWSSSLTSDNTHANTLACVAEATPKMMVSSDFRVSKNVIRPVKTK